MCDGYVGEHLTSLTSFGNEHDCDTHCELASSLSLASTYRLLIATRVQAIFLTLYLGDSERFMAAPLPDLIGQVEAGTLRVKVGKTFPLGDIVAA